MRAYRSAPLSRDARNERRRTGRLNRCSRAMVAALGALDAGDYARPRLATLQALERRGLVARGHHGYVTTQRGRFHLTMDREFWWAAEDTAAA